MNIALLLAVRYVWYFKGTTLWMNKKANMFKLLARIESPARASFSKRNKNLYQTE
jgi:hypothetical protein